MCWWPVSSTTLRKRTNGEWFRPLFLEFATLRLGIETGEDNAKLGEAKVPSQSEAVALWKSWASSLRRNLSDNHLALSLLAATTRDSKEVPARQIT